MNQPSEDWKRRLDELIGELNDQNITEEQSAELLRIFESQPGARRRFAESMHLNAMLSDANLSVEPDVVKEKSSQVFSNREQRSYRRVIMALLASSAALLVFLFWPQSYKTDFEILDEGVAVVTQSYDAKWDGENELQVGSSVSPGKIKLNSGLIQLEFYRGAVVVIEGPAELEFVDADNLICRYGRLRANVPPQAEGFSILSPQVELVDLGTEFGMDVSTDGSASVHVFDGKVELYEPGTKRSAETRKEIVESNGAVVSATGVIQRNASVSEDFVSTSELHDLTAKRNETQFRKWQKNSIVTNNNPDVLLHYSFEKVLKFERLLKGNLFGDHQLDGAIVGCRWTEGRWAGKQALEFKNPGDRVRLHIPGEYDSLTYSAWVRIDGLDRPFSALMLTNGYDVGEAHWQLRDDGRLLLGVQAPERHVAYDSKPILNLKHIGRWIHIATVYNNESKKVTHYINGKNVGSTSIKTKDFKLKFGDTEIGNWGTPLTYSPQKIRNFNGQIDELTLFNKPLTAKEIHSLYLTGRH